MATSEPYAQVAIICAQCGEPATQICNSCQKHFCWDCAYKHKVASLRDDVDFEYRESLDDCRFHPGVKYVFHCHICDTKICNDCLDGHNQQHNFSRTKLQDEENPWTLDVKGDTSLIYSTLSALRFLFKNVSKNSVSFSKDILHENYVEELLTKLQSLASKVVLKRHIPHNTEDDEPGIIYVYEVEVINVESNLRVFEKDRSQQTRFFNLESTNTSKVIWIYSKSVRVIEAKLQVYNEYKKHNSLKHILLHHDFEDIDEICQLSWAHKLGSLSHHFRSDFISTSLLKSILHIAIEEELLHENIRKKCYEVELHDENNYVGTTDSPSYICFSHFRVMQIREILIKSVVMKFFERLIVKIHREILKNIERNSQQDLNRTFPSLRPDINDITDKEITCIKAFAGPFLHAVIMTSTIAESFMGSIVSMISTLILTVDVNSKEWRGEVADAIHGVLKLKKMWMQNDILPIYRQLCDQTREDFTTISKRIDGYNSNTVLIEQQSIVKEWEKRQVMRDRKKFMDRFPSVLTYIAGRVNDASVVKVFLREEDKDAEDTFRQLCQLSNNKEQYNAQFVNVAKKKKEASLNSNREEEKQRRELTLIERKRLNDTIKILRKKLIANYSNIVGISTGHTTEKSPFGEPCIVLQCLDKTLIPFGEKKLPESLEGYPVSIREDFIMFGRCVGCNNLQNGCSIGIPSVNSAGSVGFLAKSKTASSLLSEIGFLTAAHVAVENFTELFDTNTFLSKHPLGRLTHEIVHPSRQDSNTTSRIGSVSEAFCGQYGQEEIGIDAAFVKTCMIRADQIQLTVANENDLTFDGTMLVIKDGRTTGRTTGKLASENDSISIPNRNVDGGFCLFEGCYSVDNLEDKPFFDLGDSGSGVFVLDRGNSNKALGIAFAIGYGRTYVCKMGEIVKAFNLDAHTEDEPMDQS